MGVRRKMSHQASDDFTPDRNRVADADAAVPIVDIAPFVHGDAAARKMVVATVKRACEQVGFQARCDIAWR